jgi:hypothetical protein
MGKEGDQVPEFTDRARLREVLLRQEQREDYRQRLAEEGSTADHTFADTAHNLGFRDEELDHPEVRNIVRVYNELLQLRHDIPNWAGPAIPPTIRDRKVAAALGSVDLGPHIVERYQAVDALIGAALAILGEGTAYPSEQQIVERTREANPDNHLRYPLNSALKRYGLRVVEQGEE